LLSGEKTNSPKKYNIEGAKIFPIIHPIKFYRIDVILNALCWYGAQKIQFGGILTLSTAVWRMIIVICVSRQKSVSFSSESGFCSRGPTEALKQARTKGTFWQRCTLNFLGDRTNYKAKDHWKNYKFIFLIVHIFFQLANKTRNLLFAIQ
jgi:hypothetical protein